MPKLSVRAGVVAGLVSLVLPAAALAGPANVTVRVEGAAGTLVPRGTVTTTTQPVNKSGKAGEDCSGTSAAGALERATGGEWSGTYNANFGTYTVDVIKGERHTFSDPQYWEFWINGKPASSGVCGVELQEGDDVLFFPQENCFGDGCNPSEVLDLQVPANARRGVAFTARVVERQGGFDESFNPTVTERPAAGATISVAGGAVTTGADGTAQVTLGHEPGTVTLTVTKPGTIRERETVCLTEGDEGLCGTADTQAPQAEVLSISSGEVFPRSSAPRELSGTVAADTSGLQLVKLRLTRRHRGRCSYYSGRRESFRRTRCGRAFYFGIGDRADWTYLLPNRLGPGRYVLDVVAVDKAGNRDSLARGRNRVVFTVR